MHIFYVFIGGGIGACCRYLIQLGLGKHDGQSFPWATFITNVAGCILIGLLASSAMKGKWNEAFSLFIFTGILGGFTTFSSFSSEFVQLMKNNQTLIALIYVGLSNFVGLSLCALAFSMNK